MQKEITILAHNIRFHRKKLSWSQDELANKLGIKRSNITAYETKNVEPRLRVLLNMSKLFSIRLRDLILLKFEEGVAYETNAISKIKNPLEPLDSLESSDPDVHRFIESTMKVQKILEGFKSGQRLRKARAVSDDDIQYEIDELIVLMERGLGYNETMVKVINNVKK